MIIGQTKRPLHRICAGIITLLLLLNGCTKGDDPFWDIGISTPLLKTRIDLLDIIPDTVIKGDCQNWAYIDFKQEVYRLKPDTLLDLDQAITSAAFSIPATLTLQPGQTFITSTEETDFQFQDAEIRYIIIKRGVVKLNFMNPLKEPVVCNYSLPGSGKGGIPFAAQVSVPAASGTTPGTLQTEADISGYTIMLTGMSGFSVNKITVQILANVAQSANAVQVTPFDTLKIEARFKELEIDGAFGYFGNHQVNSGLKSIHINTFDFFTGGDLLIDSAFGAIKISNGQGLDIKLKINKLIPTNTKKSLSLMLNEPFMYKPVHISRATIDPSTGKVIPTEHEFRFTPAAMKSMIELLPDKLEYEMELEINPLGNVSSGNDFMLSSSPLVATFLLEFPLSFTANGLTIHKDVDFKFSEPTVKEGKLFLIADNRFPFDATIRITMFDKDGNRIDSLNPAGTVGAGVLLLPDLVSSTRTVITIPCDAARIERLRKTTKVSLDVVLDTKPALTKVALKTDYDLHIVVSANLQTTLYP